MNADRAYHFGIRERDCSIVSNSEKHGGAWTVMAFGREVTRFHPDDLFDACKFVAKLRRLEGDEIRSLMP